MKVIQNILAIFYSLPCSSLAFKLKTSGYPLYWRREDKGGGGGGAIFHLLNFSG